jgi:hypothetical protein
MTTAKLNGKQPENLGGKERDPLQNRSGALLFPSAPSSDRCVLGYFPDPDFLGVWPRFYGSGVYSANHDARAALTGLECGACTDWTE